MAKPEIGKPFFRPVFYTTLEEQNDIENGMILYTALLLWRQ